MSVAVQCPSCKQRFAAPEELLGKKTRCPQCVQVFQVAAEQSPAASSAAQSRAVECDNCHARFAAAKELWGKRIRCPQCKSVIDVPMPGQVKAGAQGGPRPFASPSPLDEAVLMASAPPSSQFGFGHQPTALQPQPTTPPKKHRSKGQKRLPPLRFRFTPLHVIFPVAFFIILFGFLYGLSEGMPLVATGLAIAAVGGLFFGPSVREAISESIMGQGVKHSVASLLYGEYAQQVATLGAFLLFIGFVLFGVGAFVVDERTTALQVKAQREKAAAERRARAIEEQPDKSLKSWKPVAWTARPDPQPDSFDYRSLRDVSVEVIGDAELPVYPSPYALVRTPTVPSQDTAVVDLRSGTVSATFKNLSGCDAFSPDGQFVVRRLGQTFEVFSTNGERPILKEADRSAFSYQGMAFAPSQRLVVLAQFAPDLTTNSRVAFEVRIYDLKKLERIASFRVGDDRARGETIFCETALR